VSVAESSVARVASAHLLRAGDRRCLLAVESGCIHVIGDALYDAISQSMQFGDDTRVRLLMAASGLLDAPSHAAPVPVRVPVRTISLALAATCNLGCSYCYAGQGSFGGTARDMSLDVAKKAVDGFLGGARRGDAVRLVFLGGEPLANREVFYGATRYAHRQAALAGVRASFSITTNATLLTADDAAFLDSYGFAVTISVDGVGTVHDRLRPAKGGGGTYRRVVERANLLLSRQPRHCHVAARVSVTPANLGLQNTLAEFARLGFDSVQFSPVLSSPSSRGEMNATELRTMLGEMIACGELFEQRLANGEVLPFANVVSTLQRIHRGTRDEYPCGAGGSYLGISAEGQFYACHRFVGDERAGMGDVKAGVDTGKQAHWLASRNVRFQEPCRGCWARHLCGGGCHYEVINRGRTACDYIRGWLHYCIGVYVRLREHEPPRLREILEPESGAFP
jgi:uncharacterized protein